MLQSFQLKSGVSRNYEVREQNIYVPLLPFCHLFSLSLFQMFLTTKLTDPVFEGSLTFFYHTYPVLATPQLGVGNPSKYLTQLETMRR